MDSNSVCLGFKCSALLAMPHGPPVDALPPGLVQNLWPWLSDAYSYPSPRISPPRPQSTWHTTVKVNLSTAIGLDTGADRELGNVDADIDIGVGVGTGRGIDIF